MNRPGLLARVVATALVLLMLLAGHPDVAIAESVQPGGGFEVAVVEHLRVKVPAEGRVMLEFQLPEMDAGTGP